MKRTIISLLLFIMVFCCGCHTEQNPDTTTPIMPTEQTDTGQQEETMAVTMPEEVVYEGIPVETPCGTLYIPDEWDIPISVAETQGDPLVITFKAEDVELYELTFSGKAHNAIGEARTEDGIIYVGMNIRALEDETDMLMAMQESVNVLLTQLALEPVSVGVDAEVPLQDIQLETAYGQLRFPAKWDTFLMTKQADEQIVEFYSCVSNHEPVLLFRVLLGIGSDGPSSVITADDGTRTELSIVVEELELDGTWSPEEMDIVYAMQEDMNYLLDALDD